MKERARKITLTLLLAAAAALTVNAQTVRGVEINKNTYPVTGIDISQYCGEIDFNTLAKDRKGIDFIYMRATLGAQTTDTYFNQYYKDARKHDMPLGAYHFFKFRDGGTVQALNFLRSIEGKEFELPLVVDVEEYGNKGKWNKETIITNIKAFIRTVRKHRKEDIIIYSNRNTYAKYVKDYFPEHQLWMCSFKELEQFSIEWLFWQHSHTGRVSGVNHVVDMNTFNGSREQWNEYLKESTSRIRDDEDKVEEIKEEKTSTVKPKSQPSTQRKTTQPARRRSAYGKGGYKRKRYK